MATECRQDSFDFGTVEGRGVVGAFDGGVISSDTGALLLGGTDKVIGLIGRFAACFRDGRSAESIEHTVATLVSQRVFGIALGYEDLNDHDRLRHDPVLAVLAGKLKAKRKQCAAVAGKSTLSRLEHAPEEGVAFAPPRYHKIGHDAGAIAELFVTLFLEAHGRPPKRIILDLDATDDPLHGHQEGRFFHGYYDGYCYLPLYIFCGRHLLAAKLRRSNIDASAGSREEVARIVAQIRARWPKVEIWLRADSGFAREELMAWCEGNGVEYVFGLARNDRLVGKIGRELKAAEKEATETGRPARRFKDFMWRTLESWSCKRRVIGKAEWTAGGHHARQPAAAVVRIHGLCAHVRAAPSRSRRHRAGARHLRQHQAQAPEDRRPGHDQRAARQDRARLILPLATGVRPRPRAAQTCRGLRPPDPPNRQQKRGTATEPAQPASAATPSHVRTKSADRHSLDASFLFYSVRKPG
jgi:Transposase DDE domain group 1